MFSSIGMTLTKYLIIGTLSLMDPVRIGCSEGERREDSGKSDDFHLCDSRANDLGFVRCSEVFINKVNCIASKVSLKLYPKYFSNSSIRAVCIFTVPFVPIDEG